MDSPWDDDLLGSTAHHQEAEWFKLSSNFTNAGYREGISAGKESALQEGFDAGFADVGAPIGRELGRLRGMASVILNLLQGSILITNTTGNNEQLVAEARDISTLLSRIRFSDIMPPDLEAEAHAKEHLEGRGEDIDLDENLQEKKDMEALEDMLEGLGHATGTDVSPTIRPTRDSVQELGGRLHALAVHLGLAST